MAGRSVRIDDPEIIMTVTDLLLKQYPVLIGHRNGYHNILHCFSRQIML